MSDILFSSLHKSYSASLSDRNVLISGKVGLFLFWSGACTQCWPVGCKEKFAEWHQRKFVEGLLGKLFLHAERHAHETNICPMCYSGLLIHSCETMMFRSLMTMRRRPRGFVRQKPRALSSVKHWIDSSHLLLGLLWRKIILSVFKPLLTGCSVTYSQKHS